MVFVAVGAAVVGTVGSVVSANKASKTASKNNAANNALAADNYAKNSAGLAPYVNAGVPATSAIQNFLGLDGMPAQTAAFDAYKDATGYQFRVSEGERSLTSALGNKGMLNSGAAQKAALRYGQNIASAESQNYLANLQGQQQIGAGAASAQAGVGNNFTNAVTANNNAASTVQQNAALATGGAINNGLNSALSAYTYGQGMKSSYGTPGTTAGGGGGVWI